MTQEDKDLLIKDISARLPYGVICRVYISLDYHFNWKVIPSNIDWFNSNVDFFKIKPYLRPLSSMTEEENKEYTDIDNRSYSCPKDYAHIPASDRIDWLNKHHFDYRGLIEKGLAIEVTEMDNPYKD